ncbi:MAG TPA: substrate-binding domain-containing protein [Candidatus Baltobacteraceae bacterium]|jgi:ABC-type phosphate transport system substrate-binding protein|nr:substrate-binding domain-containing protein [Candidatus Baltobacteraceae bacterium]
MKTQKHIAIFALVSLAFAGCSNGSGSSPLPGGNSAQSGTFGERGTLSLSSTAIFGGGATFPAFGYNGAIQPPSLPAAGSIFASYGGTKIEYCLTGSGYGKKVFEGVSGATALGTCAALGSSPTGFGGGRSSPDLVGSDAALASADYTSYSTDEKATRGEPFEAPSIGGPIVFAYKQTDFPGLGTNRLHLSSATYCGITDGSISDWNNAKVTADNGGKSITAGASVKITFYYRSDGSGTSFLFQNHLITVCPSTSTWHTKTTNTAWVGPTGVQPGGNSFVGESGNPGVEHAIQAQTTKGAVGYVEGAYAASAGRPALTQALLKNRSGVFTDPTSQTAVNAGLANAAVTLGGSGDNNGTTLPSTRKDCILYISPNTFVNPTASTAYPIVGTSYLLFYGRGNNTGATAGHLANLRSLLTYIAGGHVGTISTEYAALPSAIRSRVSAAANGTGVYAGKACIL